MNTRPLVALIIGVLLPPLLFSSPISAEAVSEIDKLRNEIEARNDRLAQIEAEIAKYNSELTEVGAEKKTLQSAINQLELERKKVNAEISKTENQITSTDLEINKLILEISRTQKDIDNTQAGIGSMIRSEYKAGDESLIELLLSHEKLSEFWSTFEAHENIRDTLATKVSELSSFRVLLEEKRDENESKRNRLSSLKNQYSDQNQVLTNNKKEQAELLEITKSEERNYQQLLASQEQAREQVLKELRDFESKLQFILDPNTIPSPGTQVFSWPLANVIITQYFGGTEFAARNASVYGGRAYHPGVDFGAPRGTAIMAPLTGTVRATGNTDAVPGCYSWGKWTLIDHANGLTTLYAHQDVIAVSPGQKVSTGEVIGYVGNTGYSTGPHLHFTVYAKDGVNVRKFNEIKTVTSCGPASTPVAAIEAYIDPMLYLPK
ncbi:peptidoglycan DD-metalloendopeptidase family protein [Candidatus Nomurabacteria bacterium]|nr:peptidoglycan DD-metalloendopeptidase family protein [Candidatus Kaiserbacteria bacterium]MCB9810442.1 peptidoglycan DD-metalloendopeptidase family protein [Candidatus Nomurabacteria bacterium]MCB9818229.1 peptidoglycan DD-metalloendopeptidase family protein [Candidatus Nomurabacteria bacterium]